MSPVREFSREHFGTPLFSSCESIYGMYMFNTKNGRVKTRNGEIELKTRAKVISYYSSTIAKIFVYKHCFCYLNVENVKKKNSFFHQPIVLWLAY